MQVELRCAPAPEPNARSLAGSKSEASDRRLAGQGETTEAKRNEWGSRSRIRHEVDDPIPTASHAYGEVISTTSLPSGDRAHLTHPSPVVVPVSRLIVYSSLFPNPSSPTSGVFIRERMFRVARFAPIVVVAPQAWSPFDPLIRIFRKTFRPRGPTFEMMEGIRVYRPRWLSLPGVGKFFDGWLMAACTERCVRRIHSEFGATAIDAHFLYPDGWAASRIAKRLGLPLAITIRGSKDERLIGTSRERRLRETIQAAAKVFAVSESLARSVVKELGCDPAKVEIVGNGVDPVRFSPVDRQEARRRLGIAPEAKVLIGVGNLVPGKGFQRVIPLLPQLLQRHPGLVYLIVGAGASQGDLRGFLEAQARKYGVSDVVRFCGRREPDELRWYYGASDVFVLATEFEGWANVLLEAMACGLPVVTTRVGGNSEVVRVPETGELVEWWNPVAFLDAIDRALARTWDRNAILAYARSNQWDERVERLVSAFAQLSDSALPPSSCSASS